MTVEHPPAPDRREESIMGTEDRLVLDSVVDPPSTIAALHAT